MKYNIGSWYITFLQTRVGRNAAPPAGIPGRSAEGRCESHPTGRNGPGWPLRLPRIDAQDSGMHMPDHIGGGASHHHIFQSGTPYRCHDQQVVIFFVCKVVDRFVRRVLGDEDAGTGILVGKLMEILFSNDLKRSEERRVGKECRSRWS